MEVMSGHQELYTEKKTIYHKRGYQMFSRTSIAKKVSYLVTIQHASWKTITGQLQITWMGLLWSRKFFFFTKFVSPRPAEVDILWYWLTGPRLCLRNLKDEDCNTSSGILPSQSLQSVRPRFFHCGPHNLVKHTLPQLFGMLPHICAHNYFISE